MDAVKTALAWLGFVLALETLLFAWVFAVAVTRDRRDDR